MKPEQVNIFNNNHNPNILRTNLRLTKQELKEALGEIDSKKLKKRAKDNMKMYCRECRRKDKCDNYMNADYWIDTYTEPDSNNKPWQRRCPDFHSVGLGER